MPDSSLTALKKYVDKRLHRYAQRAALGFMLLTLGTGYAVYEANHTSTQNSKVICSLVVRLDQANLEAFQRGAITADQRNEARAIYKLLYDYSTINCSSSNLAEQISHQ